MLDDLKKRSVLNKKNRIYALNKTEYLIDLIISQNTHTFRIEGKNLVAQNLTTLTITQKNQRHEINIGGNKAYVSLVMYSNQHPKIEIFRNKLIAQEHILTVSYKHVSFFLNTIIQRIEPPTVQYVLNQNPDTTNLTNQNSQLQSVSQNIASNQIPTLTDIAEKKRQKIVKILSDIPNDTPNWRKSKHLGKSSNGSVYLCFSEEGNKMFAVKSLELDLTSSRVQNTLNEIDIFKKIDNEHIVKFFGVGKQYENGDPSHINIFLEYMPGGSIQDLLTDKKSLSEPVVSRYTKQILLALEYLHSIQIVHRDIKCANILIGSDYKIKLCDFGSSKFIEQSKPITFVGTPHFIAPEITKSAYLKKMEIYDSSCDIWSLGCAVIEMVTSKPPYSDIHGEMQILLTSMNSPPIISEQLSDEAKDFLSCCLKMNPNERPTASKLLEHKFITKY